MEDEERQKKVEAGKAKLAQFRQRKAHSDGQHALKKQKKKKKAANSKDEEFIQESLDLDQFHEDASSYSCQRGAAATTDYVTVRTLHSDEIIKHDQTYVTEMESEISTTADDYSSEVNGCSFLLRTDVPAEIIREEEFGFGDNYSEDGMQHSLTQLEMMENELGAKQQEIEELSRELEEMRAAYGSEGLQQLQEFEVAIKKRDDIITQLTSNLQQARKEKDETMREFLELTEQSQKLQIQFQHLQASEALRNTSHSSTAADLLQAKQQILVYQQQLEEQEQLLKNYQMKNEAFDLQVSLLQQKITDFEMEKCRAEEDSTKKNLKEKEAIIEELETKIIEEEENIFILQKKLSAAEKLLEVVKEEAFQKNQDIHRVKTELTNSKQKERQCSDEIKQLMATVEELQKQCHRNNQHESDVVQRMELETQKKLADLRAELEEVHGQQIVNMKQELVREHTIEIEKLLAQQKADLERTLNLHSDNTNEDQVHLMNIAINELNLMLQDANCQREKERQDLSQQLELLSSEKYSLQNEVENLQKDLNIAREQIQKAKKTINEKDSKLHEIDTLQITIGDLKAQLASASAVKQELESKHEAEVTNYKIKLEMLEREKDAVLDRMAESQEAELDRLRTQLLFSHEEELSKLRDDLQREHKINTENLKENMILQAKQQLDSLQNEMNRKIEALQFKNASLITKQDELISEISKLKDLHQSVIKSKSEEMMLQIHVLQKEIEVLRQEEKERGTLEKKVQEFQIKTELLERQMKEQETRLQEKCSLLETQNNVLVGLQEKLRKYIFKNVEESLTYTDGVSGRSENFDLLKIIENLIAENEKFIKQDVEHKKEIERLKSIFSFAERNLEHSYKELQEKYTSLLKIKLDLEENKSRQEAEYKTKLQSLMEEVQCLQKETSVGLKTESMVAHSKKEKILKSETFDVEEVVEKDTTELMEKLELTQREKFELSVKLSNLSEQLELKQNQISQLNEEVLSLKQDKEYILARCKDLESVVNLRLEETMTNYEPKIKYSNGKLDKERYTAYGHGNFVSDSPKEFDKEIKETKEKSRSTQSSAHIPVEKAVHQKPNLEPGLLLDSFLVNDGFAEDFSYGSCVQGENKLQEQLDMLKTEQNDLKLQMEAQRICLPLVYSAHVDQVRECLQNEKENALSALKEELQVRHAQELSELKKSQQDLQIIKKTKTDEEDSSTWAHLERLSKIVAEECSKLRQSLVSITPGNLSPYASETEKSSSVLITKAEVQVLQETLQSLLSKIIEEYRILLDCHAQFMKDTKKGEEQWASYTDYCGKVNGSHQQNLTNLSIPSQDHIDTKVKPFCWENMENFKAQLEEKHAQEIECLRSYFHQQLRETEERYTTEIIHLQNRLQDNSKSSKCFSISVESNVNEAKEMGKHNESCLQQRTDMAVELSNKSDIIELLEKQYQEKLLQEIAKVVVTMSVESAWKSELARVTNLKEEQMSLLAHSDRRECSIEISSHEPVPNRNEKRDAECEEFKSLSREISEEYGDTLSLEGQFQPDVKPVEVLCLENFDASLPTGSSPNDSELMQKRSLVTNDVSTSSIVASSQILLYEERLEDMRQELVRQYQEHQQATEILKQGHMQKMEWQKENQELLLAELDKLKVQLAQSVTLNNENITEREQVLLEELESMKKQLTLERKKLPCELNENSTQTQDENASQSEPKEHISENEDGGENNEETCPDTLSQERSALQKAYNRLLKILLEIVKTTAAVEETIGCHVVGLLDWSSKCQLPFKSLTWEARTEDPTKPSIHVEYEAEKSLSSYHSGALEGSDNNMWPEITIEGLELAEYLGVEIDSKNEEIILNISSRLQAAFEKLLETINETTNQLEHAKVTQTELMRESFKKEQEITELLKCQEELQERFEEEVKAREQLALELSKAENLIDGYADEKTLLEKQIQDKIDAIDHLEQELLCTGNKLQELEAERQQLQEDKELFFRQQDAMKADAGPVEQRLVDAAVDAASQSELLAETEKLMKEKNEVQRQAEKKYDYLQKQVKVLETDVEEQVNRFLELEEEKNRELMDLRQQNQALEKQLEKTKKFLDEQAIDREHERDVFQQEIQKLEQQLKIPQRLQPVSEHQNREVEQLTNHLRDKTDKCSELLLSKEQLQRDVQERNEEIEKLEYRIRELEQALMMSADNLQKVEEKKQFGSATKRGELPLEAQLQAEQEAVDRKEKEIINLEEQLEQFREELENKNEEVQQLHMQLEIQRKEAETRQQELEQENKFFKEDMEKLRLSMQIPEDTIIKGHCSVAGKCIQLIQQKEEQINELHEQISKLQQQLEIATDNKVIEEKNEHITELESQIEYLKSDQEHIRQKSQQEIEMLNEVIDKLTNISHKTLDFSSTQEDTDNMKHQLDVLLAEKEALVKKVESSETELSLAKNELKETKLKIRTLEKELNALKREPEIMEREHEHMQVKSGISEAEKTESTETIHQEEIEISFGNVGENAKETSNKRDIQLQLLQKSLKEKDSELMECYSQIKVLKEQTQAASEVFKQRIKLLEEAFTQKIPEAFETQSQLNVVLEQSHIFQGTQTVSGDAKEAKITVPAVEVNSTVEDATSRLSELLERLSEMESQLASAQMNLQIEKSKVKTVQKEAEEKEERITELKRLLVEAEERHKREESQNWMEERIQSPQVVIDMHENKQKNELASDPELKRIKAESAAAKEELNSYKENVEKLKEQLTVKEMSLLHLQEEIRQTKVKLVQAEEKNTENVRREKSRRKCINRTNVSCQTEKALNISRCNQTSQLLVKHEGIQIDLQNGCSPEEVAEIIREFNEKIDQMQELHAAEIMDMESRHISESDALKREQFIAVQELTEECNALKDAIEALRDKEGISVVTQAASSNARDGCSSDSSSDWGQGVYLAPNQEPDTISGELRDEGEASTEFLPKEIKGLLKAIHHEGVQVLSLTQYPYNESDGLSLKEETESWLEERKVFLSTVTSLKDLIAKMQIHRDTELYLGTEASVTDWRTELLYAIQQVFQNEKDVILAAFQTELVEAGVRDVMGLMEQLEKRLQEQGIYQKTAVEFIQNADRRSLLMEINMLRTQLNNSRTGLKGELEIESKCQELMGYNMERQMDLSNIKDKAAELQEELNSERMMVAELKNELGQTKLELETTLKAQHKHLRDLEAIRNELKGKTAELDMLKDTVASGQKKSRELQWALEKEKAKVERSEERGKEEIEDLKYSLEIEQQSVKELSNLLELERELSTNLQKKIESQEALNIAQLLQERGHNSELQVLLESERFRVLEVSSALEREKELCAQLQIAERKMQDGTLTPAEELLRDLQKQLDEKHDRIVSLVSEIERYKLESVQLRQEMEKEKQIQRKTLETEQDANILTQKKLHELESKVEDLQWQLGEKRQQIHQLQCEGEKWQEMIEELQQKDPRKEEEAKEENTACKNMNETTWDTSNERTRKWVFQQKKGGTETKELSYSALIGMGGGGDSAKDYQDLQMIRQKLKNVSSKLKELANKAASRLPFEKTDDEEFVRIQNSTEEILVQLQALSGLPSLETEMNSDLTSSTTLSGRLLKQNAELTGLVSRLSEEKNNLRNAVMKLEEELRRCQQRGPYGESTFRLSPHNGGNIDALIASEREIWNKEKRSLQHSLKQAEAELSKLRAELRNEAFLRELGADSENAVLKRIYGRYLRAESFRKALIYQKKYLLLLLGGFQECEEATLSLIARMGGQPSYTELEVITHHSKGFTRFRSTVRVLIAISRMKFLVRRWHQVTGSSLIGVSRDGSGYNTGNELQSDSVTGGLELYGEHRQSSYRSRSELESLRSPLCYQPRFQGLHSDLSPPSLACSQLQNYDPDRALTDYINRLEALQRRLGSVQPASTPFTQLHAGIRR